MDEASEVAFLGRLFVGRPPDPSIHLPIASLLFSVGLKLFLVTYNNFHLSAYTSDRGNCLYPFVFCPFPCSCFVDLLHYPATLPRNRANGATITAVGFSPTTMPRFFKKSLSFPSTRRAGSRLLVLLSVPLSVSASLPPVFFFYLLVSLDDNNVHVYIHIYMQ